MIETTPKSIQFRLVGKESDLERFVKSEENRKTPASIRVGDQEVSFRMIAYDWSHPRIEVSDSPITDRKMFIYQIGSYGTTFRFNAILEYDSAFFGDLTLEKAEIIGLVIAEQNPEQIVKAIEVYSGLKAEVVE